jgi:hypothetical protein
MERGGERQIMTVTQNCTPAVESQVREIASLLSKAAKNYQVYLPNNRMFVSSLAEAKEALTRYLEENDVLTLVVKEFELLYDNTTVYSNQDKHQSIAFRMYRDGVRLISFHSGISEEELLAFFETLTKCLECENLEEDFVTLLWEKDLQSITYYEVNDYDTDYEKRRGQGVREIDPEFRAPGSDLAGGVQWTEVTKDVERLMPALELTPGDLEEVKSLSFVVEDDLFLKRSWQVICSTFELSNTKETCLDLQNAINGFLDACVAMKQLGSAAEVLSDITTRFRAFGDEEVNAALSRMIQCRHSDSNMKTVGNCLASDREAEHDQCLAYLSQLSPGALPAVIRLLPRCTHQSARQVIVMSMASIGKDDPAEIARCSECDSEEEAEVVLDALAAIGTENALMCAMEFRDHASPKLRAKVASLAAKLKNEMAVKVTRALIQDEHPSVRRKALGSLVEIGGERCVETLMGLFTSKEFNLLPRDRKTSMLLVMRKLPPEDQKQIVETIFRMRGWLRRKALEETKAAMVDILHLMHGDVVEYFAVNLIQHVSGPLRRAAETALRKVRRDERAG